MRRIDPGAVVLTLNVSLSMSGEGVFPRTDQLGHRRTLC